MSGGIRQLSVGTARGSAREHENRSPVRHNIRVNAEHGAWQSLAASLYSPFLGVLAIRMGASNLHVALMSALPAAVSCVGSILGAQVLRPFQRKRGAACAFAFASRLFLLAIAALPLLSEDSRAGALVLLIALMNVPGAISNIAWQALMADAIPSERRGDAFAVRSRIVTAVGFLPTLVGGYLLDALSFPIGYQIVFVVAFAASVMEVRTLARIYEPCQDGECASQSSNSNPRKAPGRWALLRQVARAGFTPRAMLFYFGWMMAQPLFTIYYVRVLNCGNLWVAVFSIVSSMAQYLSFPMWSRYAAKKGNTAALAAATAGMALTPIMVAVSRWPWMVAVFNVSMGFFTSGTTLLMLNTLLGVSPSEGRTDFIAYHNAAVNLTSFIGPLIGRALVDSLNIRWALVIAGALRAAGSFTLAGLARRSEREELQVAGPQGGEAC